MIRAHSRRRTPALAIGLALWLVPAVALAQEISGVVTDATGAVLPDVNVTASSPALIEKQKEVMTDNNGRYRIVDLRPGDYTVTFARNGFNTVRREVPVSGSGNVTVSAELQVGATDTVVVSIDPIGVDTTKPTQQLLVTRPILDEMTQVRSHFNAGLLFPNMSTNLGIAQQAVGDNGRAAEMAFTVHGSKAADQGFTVDGVRNGNMTRGGSGMYGVLGMAGLQELTIDTSGVSAEFATGGPRVNLVPLQGGNTFSGSSFFSYASHATQSSNYTNDLKEKGLETPGGVELNWDADAGLGGPVVRDRLWFFVFAHARQSDLDVPNMFYNRNAGNPDEWAYVADTSRPAFIRRRWLEGLVHLTAQPASGQTIGLLYDHQTIRLSPAAIFSTVAPEAARDRTDPLLRTVQLNWTYAKSDRLLIKAGASYRVEKRDFPPPKAAGGPEMIAVLEQAGDIPNLQYRSNAFYVTERTKTLYWRLNLTHYRGLHRLTVGAGDGAGRGEATLYSTNALSYRFLEGLPNQFTMQATPLTQVVDVDRDFGAWAQYERTFARLTGTLGVHYAHFRNSFPEQHLGPGQLVPDRDLTFPARTNLSWHDATPRMGAALDVFGNGRTALRVGVNEYLGGYGTLQSGIASDANPPALLSSTATRSWSDGNGNKIPDCDLLDPAPQNSLAFGGDDCGGLNPSTFGTSIPIRAFDPSLLQGWGKRDYNWELAVSADHRLASGIVVKGGYFHRSYGNLQATDNRAVGPGDFDTFSVVAPIDPRLPGGGGYTISGFPNVTPSKFGEVDNYVTRASNYGRQTDQWSGVDLSARAEFPNGWVEGGLSTGRLTTDNCEVVAQVPEALQGGAALRAPGSAWLPASFCRQQSPSLVQGTAFGYYAIPRADVTVSAVFQTRPGTPILATYAAPNSAVRESLGRDLSGGNQSVTVHLVPPGTMYGDRLYQVDAAVGKVFRMGRSRLEVRAELYNLLNASTVLTQDNTFRPDPRGGPATWQRPTDILMARLLKFSAQFRF